MVAGLAVVVVVEAAVTVTVAVVVLVEGVGVDIWVAVVDPVAAIKLNMVRYSELEQVYRYKNVFDMHVSFLFFSRWRARWTCSPGKGDVEIV